MKREMILMKKILFLAAFLSAARVMGAAAYGNCAGMAYPLTPTASQKVSDTTLVREWSETKPKYEDGILISYGDWMDGMPDDDVSNQIGCLWHRLTLTSGKPYVIALTADSSVMVYCDKTDFKTKTSFRTLDYGGIRYFYLRAEDWAPVDLGTHDFYFKVFGSKGSVGKHFKMTYQLVSIDDIVDMPGTVRKPIPIDVSFAGSIEVRDSIERHPDLNRYATVYAVQLKAGKKYLFTGTHPSETMDLYLAPGAVDLPADLERQMRADGRACIALTVTAREDFTFMLLVMPDDLNWQTGNPGGGTLSWSSIEPPKPVEAGLYSGIIADADYGRTNVAFSAQAVVFDDGTTNFAVTATVGGAEIPFTDDGGGVIVGSTVVGGKTCETLFMLQLLPAGGLSVDGSMYLEDPAWGTTEFFFSGILTGKTVEWEDSFLRVDASSQSATDMGLGTGPFQNEPAGSEVLVKLQAWGRANNVRISEADACVFLVTGDPVNLIAEAYLLNCAPDADAVAEAKKAFVIVSFDPVRGVDVAGVTQVGGESLYGNGKVAVRTSRTIDGAYDSVDKSDATQLFYKAYLVNCLK